MKIRNEDMFDSLTGIREEEAKPYLRIFEPLKRNKAHLALKV
jgi:hypothetical protein